ncbi:hypothetical protein MLD38_001497 [Melastoma candidum]|uniref:Uncharacterized protein n=1 Tax=Melastoma candidum TaxID=119954 RepID=A0ACB9SDI8_9MYRT|nr:hypothetical protein MLD38_001497 [Melastoma candidum]
MSINEGGSGMQPKGPVVTRLTHFSRFPSSPGSYAPDQVGSAFKKKNTYPDQRNMSHQYGLLGRPPSRPFNNRPFGPPTPFYQPRWSNNAFPRARPRCQICYKVGHTAQNCYHLMAPTYPPQTHFTYAYRSPPGSQEQQGFSSTQNFQPGYSSTQNFQSPTAPHNLTDQFSPDSWLMDSGATHHVTPVLGDLKETSPYQGESQVMVGNGEHLPITHTGHKHVYPAIPGSVSSSLSLAHVLHAPALTQRLISVSKLCRDNDVSVKFHSTGFCVKDNKTKQIMLRDQSLLRRHLMVLQ